MFIDCQKNVLIGASEQYDALGNIPLTFPHFVSRERQT